MNVMWNLVIIGLYSKTFALTILNGHVNKGYCNWNWNWNRKNLRGSSSSNNLLLLVNVLLDCIACIKQYLLACVA